MTKRYYIVYFNSNCFSNCFFYVFQFLIVFLQTATFEFKIFIFLIGIKSRLNQIVREINAKIFFLNRLFFKFFYFRFKYFYFFKYFSHRIEFRSFFCGDYWWPVIGYLSSLTIFNQNFCIQEFSLLSSLYSGYNYLISQKFLKIDSFIINTIDITFVKFLFYVWFKYTG